MNELVLLFQRLASWINNGSRQTVDRSVKTLTHSYKTRIRSGLNADGSPMAPLKPSTLRSPIRRGLSQAESISTIRSNLGNTPMSASGNLADSITGKKTGPDLWEISSDSKIGNKILSSNAAKSHHGFPFIGDTPKAVRDPLQVTDKQIDLVEDQIVQDLERILRI